MCKMFLRHTSARRQHFLLVSEKKINVNSTKAAESDEDCTTLLILKGLFTFNQMCLKV